jgi:transposase-like protein
MDYHQNARLTIHSREQLAKMVVERGSTLKAAAAAFNVSAKTAAKWTRRYKEPGAGSAQGPQFKACPSPKCSRPSFSSPYDMTRASGTSSLLTVRAL